MSALRFATTVVLATLGFTAMALAQDVAPAPDAAGDEAPEAEPVPGSDPDPNEEMAQVHFRSGQNHFDRGRYEQALSEFEAAYELSPRPELQYNIYLCHERLGHLEAAVDALRRFMPSATEDQRVVLEARLTTLIERRDQLADEEANRTRPRTLVRTESASIHPLAIVGFITAGVGAVGFGVFAALSEVEDGDIAGTCGADAGEFCADDEFSTLRAYNAVADISLAVAAVGAIAATVFLIIGDTRVEEEELDTASTVVEVGPGSLRLRGWF